MKYTSVLISDGRNKLGDVVYARNRAGCYIRNKTQPTNPQTPAQQAHRMNVARFGKQWSTLGRPTIEAWNALALRVYRKDTLGQTYRPTGQNLFTACNLNLLAIGEESITAAPASGATPPTYGVTSISQGISDPTVQEVEIATNGPSTMGGYAQIFYATAQYAPTMNFVAQWMYRVVPSSRTEVSGSRIIYAFGSSFDTPNLINGSAISVGYRNVNKTTGFAGRFRSAAITIEGVTTNGQIHRVVKQRRKGKSGWVGVVEIP